MLEKVSIDGYNGWIHIQPEYTSSEYMRGVIVPPQYRKPFMIGNVVGTSKKWKNIETNVNKGDKVIYFINPKRQHGIDNDTIVESIRRDKDGNYQTIAMYWPILQGKIKQKKVEVKNNTPIIDWATAVEPFGMKMFIEILDKEDAVRDEETGLLKTETGILLPEQNFRLDVSYARVVNLGPKANVGFVSDSINKGDTVMLIRRPSGTPLVNPVSKKNMWITNSFEAMAKYSKAKNDWVPLGHWIFLKETSLNYYREESEITDPVRGTTHTQTVWRRRDGASNIELAANTNLRDVLESFGVAYAVGGGITEDHPEASVATANTGKMPFEAGDIVLHEDVINENNEYVKSHAFAMRGKDNTRLYAIRNNMVRGHMAKRKKENQAVIEYVSQKPT